MEFSSAHSMRWLSLSTVSRLNWNLECWFLWMEEKQRTRRKTHGAGMRTNKKHNTHLTPGPGILGHSGERQSLSLLCHSCFANWLVCNAEYAILFSTLTQKLRLLNPISKSKLFHLHQWTPDTYDKINKCIIQTTSLLAYDTWKYFSFNLD